MQEGEGALDAPAGLREAVRFDSGGWRRFAELGCVYGPEWWKRLSPPVIAAIVYAIAKDRRGVVRRNQNQVRGPGRGWLRERWDTYRVFAEFARSLTEGMEQWGPRPQPLDFHVDDEPLVIDALKEGRGLVMLTGHFGSWEVGARVLGRLGRPVNLVTAHESNPTVQEFVHRMRTRHGFKVIYSDRSLLTGLPVLHALRRHEIVCMQIEPWGPLPGSQTVNFCGRPALFQFGPFAVARAARAPLAAVFVERTGIRKYVFRVAGVFRPTTRAESIAALESVAGLYESLVRRIPEQWLMFEDVWTEAAAQAAADSQEMVAQAVGLRRR